MYGGEGNDLLRARYATEANLLAGGKGDDKLYGSYSSDTYLFNLGDGQDQIFEKTHYSIKAVDTLRFGKGIRPEDISMRREGYDFVFIHSNGKDEISVKDVFSRYSNWNGAWINTNQVVEKITFADGTIWQWDEILLRDIVIHANNDNSTLHGLQGNDIIHGGAGDDIIYGHEGNDVIYGGDGNDILDGGLGSNQLYGGTGDDILRVDSYYSENNLLVGGKGNDIFYGSYSADTYIFNLGDGQDQIFDPGYSKNAVDILRFGEGIRAEDITMRREGDDFLFIHSNGNDQILIKNVFAIDVSNYSDLFDSWIYSGHMVGQVIFADGTTWNWKQLKQYTIISYADNHGNILNGWNGNDVLFGNAESNAIYGEGGNDIIHGGEGNDYINGGIGSNELYGDDGDDILTVDIQSKNNILVGGTGNDTLYGSFYADTYVFNRGDGQDTIVEHGYSYYLSDDILLDNEEDATSSNITKDDYADSELSFDESGDILSEEIEWVNENNTWETQYGDNAIDKLVFGEGIAAEDVWFEQQNQDLMVKIIGTNDQILIQDWYEGKGYRIEEFHTADGRILLEAEVNKMVQAMASFAPQAGGESHLTAAMPREQLDSVIAVHWQ